MKLHPIQESFAAGEISPLLYGRTTIDGYRSGCKTLINMIANSRGPALSRVGSQHMIDYTNASGRVFTRQVSEDVFYIIYIGVGKVVEVSSIVAGALVSKTTWNAGPSYTAAEVKDLHFAISPDGQYQYFFSANHSPMLIQYTFPTDTFTFSIPTFTAHGWTAGNYPTTGTFHEARLWVAGMADRPSTFLGSTIASYQNFTTGATELDGVSLTLDSYGRIKWLKGTKAFLIGTENGEFIITSSGGVIWGGDFEIQQQSSYGSRNIQPEQVGDQIFYVSPDGLKVRAMQFEFASNNWLSNDITFFSEHITAGGIRSIAWVQNPDNILTVVLEDGDFPILSYERGNNVTGWGDNQTDGTVIDVAEAKLSGMSVQVFLVQRSSGKVSVEYYNPLQRVFMDSWIGYDGAATTTITGLSHLEGKTVQVIGDGGLQVSQVVSGGQITLDREASVVTVGLKMGRRLITLPLDQGAKTGSARSHEKSYSKVYVALRDSAHPIINGDRTAVRSPSTPMDTVQPLSSETEEVIDWGWDKDKIIDIEQDLPFDMQIISVYGELAQENL